MILVTGGTGFVGPRVVHALRERDQPVRALVRNPSGRSATTLAAWGAELVQGDMTDRESLRRAVEGCEAVVHLVAIRQGSQEQFRRVMEEGTRELVAAASEAGVKRFVLMSALGTSEQTKDLVPYYHAKWEQEQTVQGSGLEHVIFRPSFVFSKEGGILPTFRRLARLSPVTPIIGINSIEQAVEIANKSRYGLSAYLFSRDYGTVMRTVNDLDFGEIYINRTLGESIHAHHAGYKESGMGGEDGRWGLLRYTQIKTAYHHYGEA